MTAGERVTCIREAAKSLSDYEWPDIDLVLGQFGFPTSDTWSGTKNAYVIHHLQQGKDQLLNELKRYLHGEVSDEAGTRIISIESKIWAPKKFRLFISHLSEKRKIVTELKQKLEAYAIDCFVAHQDINTSLEWQNVIESALQSCDALTALLSEKFHESKWTDQEIGFAVARRVLIIPLKVGVNPYGFIGKYQAFDCKGLSTTQVAENIFDTLIENPLTSSKLSEAIVADFVASRSWESARARSLLLSKIKNWTPELLRSIENSLENNSHIPDAWGVPERIRDILATYSQK